MEDAVAKDAAVNAAIDAQYNMHTERAMVIVQLLAPPLPIMCVGGASRDGDKVSNSHDLIHAILGRLLSIPKEDAANFERVLPEAGFKGDFKAHILKGQHAITLLNGMIGEGGRIPTDEEKYSMLCTYTREVITLLTLYDVASMSSASRWKVASKKMPATIDIRFLNDMGRVNWATRPALVSSAIDFVSSFAVLRDMNDEQVMVLRKDLVDRRDYKFTITTYIRMLSKMGAGILEAERASESGK